MLLDWYLHVVLVVVLLYMLYRLFLLWCYFIAQTKRGANSLFFKLVYNIFIAW